MEAIAEQAAFPWLVAVEVGAGMLIVAVMYSYLTGSELSFVDMTASLVAYMSVACLNFFEYQGAHSKVLTAIQQEIGPQGVRVLVTVLVFNLGLLAYWYQQVDQRRYGWMMVFFATGCAFTVSEGMSTGNDALLRWVVLAVLAYVITRGFGNISEGVRSEALQSGIRQRGT
jgi:hypothetical protein